MQPMQSPRYSSAGGWAKSALSHFRVLLLDQRGTGKSTPVSTQFPPTADYLRHFKADSIVRDCEAIRKEMKLDKISILGQSFGGFCCLTYLRCDSMMGRSGACAGAFAFPLFLATLLTVPLT